MSSKDIWVYNDPQECYDMAAYLLNPIGLGQDPPVVSVEDPQRRAVGFEFKSGMRVLYHLNYTTGNPESPWYNPFTRILMHPESRAALAQCLEKGVGSIGGTSDAEAPYSRYKDEIEAFRQRLPRVS